jgi:predicted phage tail protein
MQETSSTSFGEGEEIKKRGCAPLKFPVRLGHLPQGVCEGMKKLAIAQIVLGILVIGSLIYWVSWVSTGYHIHEGIFPSDNSTIRIMGLLKPNPLMDAWTIVYFMLGLSVLGCGITQYFKARRQARSIRDEPESGDDDGMVEV